MLVLATDGKYYNLDHLRSFEIAPVSQMESLQSIIRRDSTDSGARQYANSLLVIRAWFGESTEPIDLVCVDSQTEAEIVLGKLAKALGGLQELSAKTTAQAVLEHLKERNANRGGY